MDIEYRSRFYQVWYLNLRFLKYIKLCKIRWKHITYLSESAFNDHVTISIITGVRYRIRDKEWKVNLPRKERLNHYGETGGDCKEWTGSWVEENGNVVDNGKDI